MPVDWRERYQTGETPWEKGKPHPELPFLLSEHRGLVVEAENILVPGWGFGHDANVISSIAKGQVFGSDVADEAIGQAKERYSGEQRSWVVGDLFESEGNYDLVFEHTFFCAIPVERRSDYVATMARLIPQGGHLLALFFLNPDHKGEEGPPFGVTVDELKGFFEGAFEMIWSQPPSKTFEAREGDGRELSILWRRLGD